MRIAGRLYQTRYRILERDNFTCQYCGRSAPDVVLNVDHRVPRSEGGTDEDGNLVTACQACNIGKSDTYKATARKRDWRNLPTPVRDAIIAYVREHGPSTTAQIAHAIGKERSNVSSILHRGDLFRRVPRTSREVYYELIDA